jgi:branched-chain amino acid transport system substrate-binding protein
MLYNALFQGGIMTMHKIAASLAVAGLFALPAAHAQLKIGFVAELSGPQAPLGQDQYDALMMFIEANGGKLGGVPVQVIKEDSQLKPDVASQVVDKLIEKDKVPIITGITFSNIMMTVHKKITEKGIFLIGSNAGPAPIAGAACSPYFFSTSWQNDTQAEVVGKYASDQGYKNVMAMAPNYQAGKDFVSGFKRTYKGTVIDELYPALNTTDFSADLAQIASKKPDAIYVFMPGGLGVNFVKQFHQAGLGKNTIVLSASTVDGTTLPALKDAALGWKSGTYWGPDFKNEANQKFVEAFEKKTGRIPSQYAAQSYDAAQLLDSAIRKVGGKIEDKKAFHAALMAADFKSIRGNFKFNTNQFPIQDMHMFQVANDAKGRTSLKTISTPLTNHVDSYVGLCKMATL